MHQMIPLLEITKDTLAQVKIEEAPREILAYTGYWNEESLTPFGRPGVREIFSAPFRKARGLKRQGRDRAETKSSYSF